MSFIRNRRVRHSERLDKLNSFAEDESGISAPGLTAVVHAAILVEVEVLVFCRLY